MIGWTARALSRLTNVPPATIGLWIAGGLVKPDKCGRGRGGHLIGITGLLELLAVIELREARFSTKEIRQAVENLRALSGSERPLAHLTLIVNGNDIAWKDAHELVGVTISALQQPGQRLMIFQLGHQHAELLNQLQVLNEEPTLGTEASLKEMGAHVS